jgi:hypothetical protein
MLGLLFIYFIGNAFYKLAEQHNRSRWGFALLGIATYYGVPVFLAFIAAVFFAALENDFIEAIPEYAWTLISIPIGLGSVYGLYLLLKSQWKKKPASSAPDILDAELMNTNRDL